MTEIISDRQMEGAAWMIRTEARGQSSEVIREEMDRLLVDYNRIMSTRKEQNLFYEAYVRGFTLCTADHKVCSRQ